MFFNLLLFGILVARFTWSFQKEKFNVTNVVINCLTLMVAVLAIIQ